MNSEKPPAETFYLRCQMVFNIRCKYHSVMVLIVFFRMAGNLAG